MPRESVDVVTNVFYKHDDKAAAATKDTKRANSPAPKKEEQGFHSRSVPDSEVRLHCSKTAEGNFVL